MKRLTEHSTDNVYSIQSRFSAAILALSLLNACSQYTAPQNRQADTAPTDTEQLSNQASDAQAPCNRRPCLNDSAEAGIVLTPSPSNDYPDTWWQPTADTPLTWDWQIGHLTPQPNANVDVYNIDIDTDDTARRALANTGAKLICYFSVGTVENWRDDADQFPALVIGERYEQLPGERWLNYKRIDLLAPIMLARFDRCARLGFHAVEADNVDAFNYETRNARGEVIRLGTNFKITEADTIAYVRWLAEAAHSRGLAIGLKNAEAIAEEVVDVIDFMVTEECVLYDWCDAATVVIEHNKPVLAAEYIDFPETQSFSYVCQAAQSYGFFASHFKTSLNNAYFAACDPDN